MVIVFGEQRNSDEMFVDRWKADPTFNPPTLADMPGYAYDDRKHFPYGATREVYDYIVGLVKNLLKGE